MNRTRIAVLLLGFSCFAGLPFLHAQEANSPSTSTISANPNPTLDDAIHLYRAGKFDAAIQEYQALETGPQAAIAYTRLTRAYLRKRDPENAYAAAAKAAELAPDAADTRVALGEIYFRQGKIADAEHQFVMVINSGAKNAQAYLGLARVSRAISLYRREKQMLDRAHELDPGDPDITRPWMATLTLGERIKALRDNLVQNTDIDPEARTAMERQLARLQDQASIPVHQCRMVSKVSSTQTDLKTLLYDASHVRGAGMEVKLNGVSAKLLLDTGASGILVDRRIADKAGVKEIVQTKIGGYGDNGPAAGYVAHADSIQIGEIEFQDCNVRVEDRGSVIGNDGLIGADVFSHFLVDIDLPNEKFRLSELPPRPDEPAEIASLESGPSPDLRFHDRYVAPEMRDYTPVFRFGHMLLIPTKLNDSVPKLFLIDTGAFGNTISPAAAREVTRVSGDSRIIVKGLSGEVKNVYRGDELSLTFANLRQKNFDIVAFDNKNQSDSIGTEISGGLGFLMLKMLDMKIDYRDGLVFFAYDSKRYH